MEIGVPGIFGVATATVGEVHGSGAFYFASAIVDRPVVGGIEAAGEGEIHGGGTFNFFTLEIDVPVVFCIAFAEILETLCRSSLEFSAVIENGVVHLHIATLCEVSAVVEVVGVLVDVVVH